MGLWEGVLSCWGVLALRVRGGGLELQSLALCPKWKHFQHLCDERQRRAIWSVEKQLKHLPSILFLKNS
jgi:hypothetical protein